MLTPTPRAPKASAASGEVLPPEIEVRTPGAVIVVDDAGRLRDRSPRAAEDAELAALSLGALVPHELLTKSDARRLVHDGTPLDALWFARGEAPIAGGLSEREVGAMITRLRNVVGVVVASLDTEDLIGPGPASSPVGSARRREVDRLIDAVATLAHAFAPTSKQQGDFAREAVDLELVVRRAIDALRGAATRRGVTLRLDGAREARRPRTGDQPLLAAALDALLANAVDATAHGGEVRVRVEAGPASVAIHVEDDGPGLLRPSRGEPGTPFSSSKRSALGLGLVVARRAAFIHGGELHVATRDAGSGVRASIWIPVV